LRPMFVGGSQAILRVQELIDKAARSGSTVLIIGESGVGKDVASNEIHARSKRSGRFLAVNCAAIPGDLIESELFGHERGAFTSASARRLGIFEQANGGTVFLDEITEMKPELQPKLLRVLEDHKIRRVGGEESIQVNVRVIAATNRPLHEALESRKLREDLYYRLNVFRIAIPPLRERLEDLDLLVAHFVEELNQEHGKDVDGLDAESLAAFKAYGWPGNVRELRNAIERAVITRERGRIALHDLPEEFYEVRHSEDQFVVRVGSTVEAVEQELIRSTLDATNGNRSRAADILGVSRRSLYVMLHRNGFQPRGKKSGRSGGDVSRT
jgi:transcriptional regulator with PAS, ATPase and Fis domain